VDYRHEQAGRKRLKMEGNSGQQKESGRHRQQQHRTGALHPGDGSTPEPDRQFNLMLA
jgi:hypothetical protein